MYLLVPAAVIAELRCAGSAGASTSSPSTESSSSAKSPPAAEAASASLSFKAGRIRGGL